ncbi:hypothetical protein [Bullifex porci]|uniref:hypothetical protein n=1 Tax=Bullifex porci TaxID=2606638 RepID=UPI0023F40E4E|nr:hypothetical protein [Bullifex porci]MDD7588948.1 hypothetical protein [Bullifex porci]
MKKYLLLIFFIFLLLVGCKTTKDDVLSEEQIIQLTQELKNDINEAILESESKLSTELKVFTSFPAYDRWREVLPGFNKLEASYLNQIDKVLAGALINISDVLLSYIKDYQIQDVNLLVKQGYSSLSEILEQNMSMEVKAIFKKTIEDESDSIDFYYKALEQEAFIWKSNIDNLALVGINNDLEMIDKIDDELIAELATEIYFNVLSQSEVKVRTAREV